MKSQGQFTWLLEAINRRDTNLFSIDVSPAFSAAVEEGHRKDKVMCVEHSRKPPLRRSLTLDLLGTTAQKQCARNLYLCCKYIFIFGKGIGVIPFDSGMSKGGDHIASGGMGASVIGITLVTLMWCNALVGFQSLARSEFNNVADYSKAPTNFIFYSVGTFIFWHLNRRVGELLRLMQYFGRVRCHFPYPDYHLYRDVNVIFFVVMTSTILENLLNHVRFDQPGRPDVTRAFGYDPRNESFLRIYYEINCGQWKQMMPYSVGLSLYVFVCNKLTWYAWNLSDVFVLVLSRALYFKFSALYKQGLLVTSEAFSCPEALHDKLSWKQIAQDHYTLWCLLVEIRDFISPLIFVSIAVNTYVICLQIHFTLSNSSNITSLDTLYAVWSVVHIWGRVYAMCTTGSRVHEWAHKVVQLLRTCPSTAMSMDVQRAERFGNWHVIGWTGMNCFLVTKNLLMKIIGVVVTFEIIILQASEQLDSSQPTSPACAQSDQNSDAAV